MRNLYHIICVCHVLMCACDHVCVVLIRRNKVQATVTKEWPGNQIPIFKGPESKKNTDRLDQLIQSMLPDCQFHLTGLSLPIVFGPKAIRQNALDCLNERRRRVHKGHDFDEVLLQTYDSY